MTSVGGTITYYIGHKHTGSSSGGGCYTTVAGSYKGGHSIVNTGHYSGGNVYHQCVYCGRGSYEIAQADWTGGTCSGHTIYTYSLGCGKSEGEIVRTTTNTNDLNNLSANEMLKKAEIEY